MGVRLGICAITLVALWSNPAHAQRCTKGIPCGGSCIAASKTCRVGAPPATKAPAAMATDSLREASLRRQDSILLASRNRRDTVAAVALPVSAFLSRMKLDLPLPLSVSVISSEKQGEWMKEATLTELQPDYFVVERGPLLARIPLSSLLYWYTENGRQRVVLVLR